jgi:hypothetical protein
MGSPAEILASLCDSLPVLNARVAEEFLALAAVLQSTLTHVREISAESHKAIDSDATKQVKDAIGMLRVILSGSQGMNELVEVSHSKMIEILEHVKASRAPLWKLAKMRSRLQTMTVLSRIEGERITNNLVDLSGLSEDIHTLAGEVQRHLDGIMEDSAVVSELLQKSVLQLGNFERQEHKQVADLIRHTRSVLGPMIDRLEATEATAHDIDEQYTSFRRATEAIVMSLQSEDITRQRVEHILEALRRIDDSLDAGANTDSCAGVLALQTSQLSGTRDLLAKSIHSIHEGLLSLESHIQELEDRTASLVKQMDQEGPSFSQAIDAGLSAVSSVSRQCSMSVQATVSLVDSALPSIEAMTKAASALEDIEASIRLISLNATIKTAHLGSDGAAMGVIAHELHSIAQNSEHDIHIMLDELSAISDALNKIVKEESLSGDTKMICEGDGALKKELAGLPQAVGEWSRGMAAELKGVVGLAAALRSELAQGREITDRASNIPKLFDNELQRFDEALGRLGHTRETAVTAAAGLGAGELLGLYSMQSERKLHAEVFGAHPREPESLNPSPTQNQPDEFGDNIELF